MFYSNYEEIIKKSESLNYTWKHSTKNHQLKVHSPNYKARFTTATIFSFQKKFSYNVRRYKEYNTIT